MSTMLGAINKIRNALASKEIVPHLTHYLIRDGMIHASDGRIQAAAPVPGDLRCLVPGKEFEDLLERMPETPTITVESGVMKIKAGRLRGSIQLLDEHLISPYIAPVGNWGNPPIGLLDALSKAQDFISDNASQLWATCVCLMDGQVLATNNVSLAAVECPTLKAPELLLPIWAVNFLLKRKETLTGIVFNKDYAAFRWEDGSWLRTQLVVGEYPAVAKKLLADAPAPEWEIPKDWREAYATVAPMTNGVLKLTKDCMSGIAARADVSYDVESPMPEGREYSQWTTAYLNPVLKVATHWAPDKWPGATPFKGDGVKGLIVGANYG